MRIGALLLAAGMSRRFGPEDKLLADLNGMPMVAHAARALDLVGPDRRIAVTGSDAVGNLLSAEGFDIVALPAAAVQSDSLKAGIAALQQSGVTQALVTLGDMPFLLPADIAALIALASDQPAAAWLGDRPHPPAIFPESWFAMLMTLTGDRGAGACLGALPPDRRLALPPARLTDIDSLDDLRAARSAPDDDEGNGQKRVTTAPARPDSA